MQTIHVPRCGIVGSHHPVQVDADTAVASHDRVDDFVERCDPRTQGTPQWTGQPQDPTVASRSRYSLTGEKSERMVSFMPTTSSAMSGAACSAAGSCRSRTHRSRAPLVDRFTCRGAPNAAA